MILSPDSISSRWSPGLRWYSLRLLGEWLRSLAVQVPARGALRVTLWGALAMALTAGVGALFGAVV